MDSVNRLITAKDYCAREGAGTVKERIMKRHAKMQRKSKVPLAIKLDVLSPRPVKARIELGQVIADCECGCAEFVDRDEPFFYCFECFNRRDGGALRPVQFPDETTWQEITRLVLLRPVEDVRGMDDADRAAGSRAVIYLEQEDGRHLPLTRTWNPGESIEDLLKENEAIEKWELAKLEMEKEAGQDEVGE
jgi:hypothetical protein